MKMNVLLVAEYLPMKRVKEWLESQYGETIRFNGLAIGNPHLKIFNLANVKDWGYELMDIADVILIWAFDEVIGNAVCDDKGKAIHYDGRFICEPNTDGIGLDLAMELVKGCPEIKDRIILIAEKDEYYCWKNLNTNDPRLEFLDIMKPMIYPMENWEQNFKEMLNCDPRVKVNRTKSELGL